MGLKNSQLNVLKKISEKVKEYYGKKKGAHDLEHTLRVLRLAEKLCVKEKADSYIVQMACWVHDMARHEEDKSKGRKDHALIGAKKAVPFLVSCGASEKDASAAAECVKTHRFRGKNKPVSIEAKVVFDADKLDSIGAVGIGRAFQFAGEVGAKLHNPEVDILKTKAYTSDDTAYREYMVKLRHVKKKMLTLTGKKMAQKRHLVMEKFFSELTKETKGIS